MVGRCFRAKDDVIIMSESMYSQSAKGIWIERGVVAIYKDLVLKEGLHDMRNA